MKQKLIESQEINWQVHYLMTNFSTSLLVTNKEETKFVGTHKIWTA